MDGDLPALIARECVLRDNIREIHKAGMLLIERRRMLVHVTEMDPETRAAAAFRLREEWCDLARQ
jgi:hypothetical protein